MTYAVTKRHKSGPLRGTETHEITGIKFHKGRDYGDYICTECKELNEDSTVQIMAFIPSPNYGTAFTSGTLRYIRKVKKAWASAGYYNIHMWSD